MRHTLLHRWTTFVKEGGGSDAGILIPFTGEGVGWGRGRGRMWQLSDVPPSPLGETSEAAGLVQRCKSRQRGSPLSQNGALAVSDVLINF